MWNMEQEVHIEKPDHIDVASLTDSKKNILFCIINTSYCNLIKKLFFPHLYCIQKFSFW